MFKKLRNSSPSRLVANAASLVRVWWRQDRIRSSPLEGKLLRLAPGAILCIEREMITVEDRSVIETPVGSILRYTGRSTSGTRELWVTVEPTCQLIWVNGRGEYELSVDDVEVWG